MNRLKNLQTIQKVYLGIGAAAVVLIVCVVLILTLGGVKQTADTFTTEADRRHLYHRSRAGAGYQR